VPKFRGHHCIRVPNHYIHRNVSIFLPMAPEDMSLVMHDDLLNKVFAWRLHYEVDAAGIDGDCFPIRSKGKTGWLRPQNIPTAGTATNKDGGKEQNYLSYHSD
jgi:hypothetical protein